MWLSLRFASPQLQSQLKARQADLDKALQAAIPAPEWLRAQLADKFSAWDEASGLPTLDTEGKEVSKKGKQNAEKMLSKQTELNRWWAQTLETQGAGYLDQLRGEIARLQGELEAANK